MKGSQIHHGAPECRCGSRNTRRIGDSALLRQCQDCGETYAYRVVGGLVVPFAPATALLFDASRLEAARA